jgi:hypothetical protein
MTAPDLNALLDALAARVADRVAPQVAERLHPLLKALHDAAATSELLDTPAAAARLGCSAQFLEIARHDGNGPRYYKVGKHVRYAIADLDEFLATRARDNTARPFRSKKKPTDVGETSAGLHTYTQTLTHATNDRRRRARQA